MNFQIVQPTGFLKKYIKHYCFMDSGIREGDVMERVIPTDSIQLMFHYKNPFVVYNSGETITKQPRSILSGLYDTFTDVSTHGEAGVVFVGFYPVSACFFLNFPLSEIENQSIDLSDIFKAEIRQIEEMLYSRNTIVEKVAVIENFLVRKFSPVPASDYLIIQKGVEFIKNCKGQTNASSLSHLLSIAPKTLERKFSQYLGKTTKQVIKLIRFQNVLRDFSSHKSPSLTEIAYTHGYFDQSHFIHDFKRFSGYTPREFIVKYPDFNMDGVACS